MNVSISKGSIRRVQATQSQDSHKIELSISSQPGHHFQKLPLNQLVFFSDKRLDTLKIQESLESLIESVQKWGLIEPLIVCQRDSDSSSMFQVLSGARRLAACTQLNLSEVPCLVIGTFSKNDALDIYHALHEETRTHTLNPLHETKFIVASNIVTNLPDYLL